MGTPFPGPPFLQSCVARPQRALFLWERTLRCRKDSFITDNRLITGASRRDHITPILQQLHWLPVRLRVNFKIAVLVFQCLTGQAPGYLAEDCQLVADVSVRRLRSADTATCVTRRTSNIFVGDRCFAAAGPRLWNSLPINLRQCRTLEQFKRLLKTFLFSA